MSCITTIEIKYAVKAISMKKAPGPDDIYTKMFEAAGESALTESIHLANMMYKEGYLPEEMNKSIFITIPKVTGTEKCKMDELRHS